MCLTVKYSTLFLEDSLVSFHKQKKYLFLKCTLQKFHFYSGFELEALSHAVAEQYSHRGGIFREQEAEYLELVAEWFAGKTLVCGKTLFVSKAVCSREIKD